MNFWSVTTTLMEGFGTTCLLFLLTLVFSLPFGLIIAFGSMSKFKPLAWLCRTVVWIIRGTPLMLQLFVVFYVPGILFDVRLFTGDRGRFTAALVAFVINYACYFSEIYRGGIESIPRGQFEAAQVLDRVFAFGGGVGGAEGRKIVLAEQQSSCFLHRGNV